MKRKKRRLKKKKILLALFILIIIVLVVFGVVKLFGNNSKIIVSDKTKYLASDTTQVQLYAYNEENKFIASDLVYRGVEIKTKDKKITEQEQEYTKITLNEKTYYVLNSNLVDAIDKVALEKTVYVRTASSILEDTVTAKIIGFAKKGEQLEVLEAKDIDSEGMVGSYKIKQGELEGFVYGKYLVFDQETANSNYNAGVNDPIHSAIKNSYGGGEAIKLDFYPVEKVSFEGNKMPEAVYGLYINCWPQTLNNIDAYISLARETKINTFIVDIKDNGSVGYPSNVMQEFSPITYQSAMNDYDAYKAVIKKIKDAGFYVAGRITVFKDDYYVADHPEDAITLSSTGNPYKHQNSYWPSVYSRNVWYYNTRLAVEAVKEMGFNEINFDYVRFPDGIRRVETSLNMKNTYGEDKCEAVQRFLQYATDEIHKANAYVSVDVFGETTNGSYTVAYGQYWPAISNVVDVISGMPYPDHFSQYSYGITDPWNNPYDLMYSWATDAVKRQGQTTSPAIVRTWIQAYNVLSHVDANGIAYNAPQLEQEIRGLYEAGATGGFVTWNGASNIDKYTIQKAAFQIDYLKEYNE